MGEIAGGGQTLARAWMAAAGLMRQAGIATPELDARLLLCHAASIDHETFVAGPDQSLAPELMPRFGAMVERRLRGVPVSRLIGLREFYGRSFIVNEHALDPRPDTETLIKAALAAVDQGGSPKRALRFIDLGTGTGCILITLLAELPAATGIGVDRSADALALARENAQRLGVAERAQFASGDWLEGFNDGACETILVNPPYIASAEIAALAPEVRDHDPRLALDGGEDGLAAYRRIAARAGSVLQKGGKLIVEIGSGQADAVQALLRAAGLDVDPENSVRRDLAGHPRCIVASS